VDQPLVVETAELPQEGWQEPSRGSVTWRTVISKGRTATSGITLGIAELAPDGTVGNPRHRHPPSEVYYVLEGRGVVEIDGATTAVGPGTAVSIPGDAWHSLANTGAGPLRLLYAFGVDSFDDITYAFPDA
jgi:mannose-6-phosphate isomerase-like protein (cupin superfamily)